MAPGRPQGRPPSKRSPAVTLGITALLAAGLSGCSSPARYDYAGVCVDPTTNRRVDDAQCRRGGGGYGWYYIPVGARIGAIGATMAGGATRIGSGAKVTRGGAPAAGSVMSRGGFGGKARSVGG